MYGFCLSHRWLLRLWRRDVWFLRNSDHGNCPVVAALVAGNHSFEARAHTRYSGREHGLSHKGCRLNWDWSRKIRVLVLVVQGVGNRPLGVPASGRTWAEAAGSSSPWMWNSSAGGAAINLDAAGRGCCCCLSCCCKLSCCGCCRAGGGNSSSCCEVSNSLCVWCLNGFSGGLLQSDPLLPLYPGSSKESAVSLVGGFPLDTFLGVPSCRAKSEESPLFSSSESTKSSLGMSIPWVLFCNSWKEASEIYPQFKNGLIPPE